MNHRVAVLAECGAEYRNAPKLRVVKRKPSKRRLSQIEKLILEHRESGRKLSRSILRKWRVRMSSEEVDSIVDYTLCDAAHRYEANRGASFMTFFYYHLRGHLVRAVATAAHSNQIFVSFTKAQGLDVADWTITNEAGSYSAAPEFALFGQKDIEGPEQLLLRKEKISICRGACSKLDELEQEVLFRSFSDEQPLVEIAKQLGYSRCHISRVKRRALERLKSFLDVSGLHEKAQASGRQSSAKTALVLRAVAAQRQAGKRRIRRRRTQTALPTMAMRNAA